MDEPRHLAYIKVPPGLYVALFTTGEHHVKVQGLPPGVQHIECDYDQPTGYFRIKVEHPSFAPVEDGSPIPDISETIRFERL